MECIQNDSYIVTIAIQTHGKVIDLNLSPDKVKLFENVRLFSLAGGFRNTTTTIAQDEFVLLKVKEMFQRDIDGSTFDLMNTYSEYSRPKYRRFLGDEKADVCKVYNNLIFDKGLFAIPDRNCVLSWLIPDVFGIFVISVHKKAFNNLQLVYPSVPGQILNLLNVPDFQKFSQIFDKQRVIDELIRESSILNTDEYTRQYDNIEKNLSLSFEQKKQLLEPIHAKMFEELQQWKLTIKNPRQIESIKMSTLVDTLKRIMGDNCYLNILDYSCNSGSASIPAQDRANMKYLEEETIETPTKRWGGNKKRFTFYKHAGKSGVNKTRRYKKRHSFRKSTFKRLFKRSKNQKK